MKRYFSIILAIAATVSAQIVPSTGNVRGPTSATDNAVARYDGTTGKLIQNSGVTIDDSGNLTVSGVQNVIGSASASANFPLRINQGATDATVTMDIANVSSGTSAAANIQLQTDAGTSFLRQHSAAHSVWPNYLLLGGSDKIAISTGSTSDGIELMTGFTTRVNITTATTTVSNNLKLSAYGAGTLTTDSSGNVTATSDERAKNIIGTFTKGLAEVVKLTPKTYTWKPETGLNTTDEVASLTAQDLIAAGIPEAVSTYRTVADLNDDGTPKLDADGKPLTKRIDATYTVSDRAVIAALVNAVKELNAKVAALETARK